MTAVSSVTRMEPYQGYEVNVAKLKGRKIWYISANDPGIYDYKHFEDYYIQGSYKTSLYLAKKDYTYIKIMIEMALARRVAREV